MSVAPSASARTYTLQRAGLAYADDNTGLIVAPRDKKDNASFPSVVHY